MYVETADSFFTIYCKFVFCTCAYEKYVFIGVLLFLGSKNLQLQKTKMVIIISTICVFCQIKSDCPIGFELTMESFKHSKGQSQTLYVERNKEDYTVCPVQALWTYFQVRKPSSGPLFIS